MSGNMIKHPIIVKIESVLLLKSNETINVINSTLNTTMNNNTECSTTSITEICPFKYTCPIK